MKTALTIRIWLGGKPKASTMNVMGGSI
jgi:hypothetical protein